MDTRRREDGMDEQSDDKLKIKMYKLCVFDFLLRLHGRTP